MVRKQALILWCERFGVPRLTATQPAGFRLHAGGRRVLMSGMTMMPTVDESCSATPGGLRRVRREAAHHEQHAEEGAVGQFWGRLAEFGLAVFLAAAGFVYVATGEARHREAGIFLALLGGAWLLVQAARAVLGLREEKARADPPGEDRTWPGAT
jgi:hypothetical protein